MDGWNAEDENVQARNNSLVDDDGQNETEDEINDRFTEESNSTTNLDTSIDTNKSLQPRNGKAHIYSDDKTMDLFSSDTNQTTDFRDDENDSKDSSESIKLRLDSIDDTQDATNADNYTRVKSPTSSKFQEQSSEESLSHIQAGQKIPENTDKKKRNNEGLTSFARIKRLLGMDSSSDSNKEKVRYCTMRT